jgi:hypothetical protein
MLQRCYNPTDKSYRNYGARGIGVFQEWQESFAAYRDYTEAQLGPKPSPSHSIDRINNDRGYEPGNIRWATRAEQAQNRRKFSHWRWRLSFDELKALVLALPEDQRRSLASALERSAPAPVPTRPGDAAAIMHEETGIDYSTCLVMCNMD